MAKRPIKMTLPDKNTRRLASVAKNGASPQNLPPSAPQQKAYASGSVVSMPFSRTAQAMGGGNTLFTQPMFFSPLHTPQNWQIASKRQEVYQWARFYYENEPKVAAGIDFYAQFPINGYKLECKSKKIQKFFERLCDELEILRMLRLISHERFLLGDVFVFLDIDSPDTRGETDLPEAEWTHADGTISRIIILNPDWIEVYNTPLADEPEIVLLPDDELKKIVQMKQPRSIYDRLPEGIKEQVLSARPIRLSNRVTSHIKHGGAPYGTYGDSLLRRLFTMLAYKTKLMTANWIVAERLVLPVRVVKIGDKDRPASEDDIADVQAQLGAIANDPNLTVVTHHAFDYEWYGATGKIHNITNELESIGKEILDGMMINQALLNGEMAAYSSAQVGVELLIRRLESWRNELADWVEKNIFLIVAKMQGFVDEDASKEAGETVYIYPNIKWDDLRLRDPTNRIQQAIQLNQNGVISNQTLLEMMDLDYDQEVHKIREEQVMVGPQGGMMPGGPGGMPGGDPMGGGMGGGMPGGDPMGGGMGGGMPGGDPMGGGMAGGMGGGMAGGGGAPGAMAGGAPPQRISKRGKKQKEEEVQPVVSQQMQLTKPEAKTLRILEDIGTQQEIYLQYKVQVPGQQQPYALDFAYPQIGLNIEADGEKWHTSHEDKISDQERDVKLAQQGWTVVRVSESALNENAGGVKDLLTQAIAEATELRRKMGKKSSNNNVRFVQASVQNTTSPYVLTYSKPSIIEEPNA